MDDDRARVATYALSRCTRWIPPTRLTGLLTGLLREAPKVVVRKEAARLVATHHLTDAIDTLTAAAHADPVEEVVHRDVRIAALSGLTAFPDVPEIWPALQAAATDPDPHIAASLLSTRWTALPTAAREPYAQLICAVAGHPNGTTAHNALTVLPDWYSWAGDQARQAIYRSLTDLGRRDTWQAAAGAAVDPAVWTIDPALPADLATALIARLDQGPDAGPTRDLPARRRLDYLLHWLGDQVQEIQAHPDAALTLADTLAARPPGRRRPAARAAHRPWPLRRAPPHPGGRPARRATRRRGRTGRTPAVRGLAITDTDQLITSLLHRSDSIAGRFALALTVAAGQATNWNHPWDNHLRALRRHHDPDLRDAALAIRTAPE